MRSSTFRIVTGLISVGLTVLLACSGNSSLVGGTSETSNGFTLALLNSDGSVAKCAKVRVRPSSFVVGVDSGTIHAVDTTADSSGRIALFLSSGDYAVEAVDSLGNGVLTRVRVASGDSMYDAGFSTLYPTGRITGSIIFEGTDPSPLSAAIEGTAHRVMVDSIGRFSLSLPRGDYGLVILGHPTGIVRIADVPVRSEEATAVRNIDLVSATATVVRPPDRVSDSTRLIAFIDSQGIDRAFFSRIAAGSQPPEHRIRAIHLERLGIAALHPAIQTLNFAWHLYLTKNPIAELPPQLYTMTKLAGLSIDSTLIDSLPDDIGRLRSLQWLSVRACSLVTFPDSLSALPDLSSIYLSANGLTTIPEVICRIPILDILDVKYNALATLPPSIGSLKRLRILDVSNNPLTSLPPEIGGLTGLRTLYVYNCALDSLPWAIGGCTALSYLNATGNRLTDLPPSFGALANLGTLVVWGNELSDLPVEIVNCTALKTISLGSNRLCSLHPDVEFWLAGLMGSDWRTRYPQQGCE